MRDMKRRWPKAKYVEDYARHRADRAAHFRLRHVAPDQPLRVVLIGTDFEVRVWEKLLDIPMGKLTTYSDLAAQSRHTEGRARGRRRGRQESDLLRGAVPSRHRQERRLTGYHWGLTRKRAMLGWEAGMAAAAYD